MDNRHAKSDDRKKPPIVLIGGTGDVGQRLVPLLFANTDRELILISRKGGVASERIVQAPVDIRAVDAAKHFPAEALVVNLTEATPLSLAEDIINRGGTFIDTSASPDYVTALAERIKAAGGPGTGILCVGTAPGLSNLMALDLTRSKHVKAIEIGLELGMGRHYGASATEWFFHALGKPYSVQINGQDHLFAPGQLRRRFAFGSTEPWRFAMGIGFTDLGLRCGIADKEVAVRTFLAVDPVLLMHVIGIFLRLGLGPWMSARAVFLTRLLARSPTFGRVQTRVAVEAQTVTGTRFASHNLVAGDQAELTAAMILITIQGFENAELRLHGITTIGDYLTFASALENLRRILPSMSIEVWSSGGDAER